MLQQLAEWPWYFLSTTVCCYTCGLRHHTFAKPYALAGVLCFSDKSQMLMILLVMMNGHYAWPTELLCSNLLHVSFLWSILVWFSPRRRQHSALCHPVFIHTGGLQISAQLEWMMIHLRVACEFACLIPASPCTKHQCFSVAIAFWIHDGSDRQIWVVCSRWNGVLGTTE